jgi:UDP-glucose 4-epimerase
LHDVEKVLFASSSEIYGSAQYTPIDEKHPLESGNPYGASKIAGDRLCHAYATTYGMDIGIIRPFNIYGIRQKDSNAGVIPIFINRVLNNKSPIIYGDGTQSRDYIYVDDVISAYDCMLNAPHPGAVNFGTGCGTSVTKLAETIINICKQNNIKSEYRNAPPNTTMNLVADISKAKQLGWSPQYTLEVGITKFIDWYKEVR